MFTYLPSLLVCLLAIPASGTVEPCDEPHQELLKALASTEIEERKEALFSVMSMREVLPPKVRAAVLQRLKDDEPSIRSLAIMVLARRRPVEAVFLEAICDRLHQDSARHVRYEAADSLGWIGKKARSTLPALERALKDDDLEVRAGAAGSIRRLDVQHPQAIHVLIDILEDKQAGKMAKHRAMSNIRHPKGNAAAAVPALIELLNDPTTGHSVEAAQVLGDIGPDARAAVPQLEKKLTDPALLRRQLAAMDLVKIDPTNQAAVPVLVEALKDTNDRGRLIAAGSFARDFAVEVLWPWATGQIDLDEVQHEAKDVYERWERKLKDTHADRRSLAAWSLSKMGPAGQDAVPLLRKTLRDQNQELRLSAAGALVLISPDHKDALKVLIKGVKSKDPALKQSAISRLRLCGHRAQAGVKVLTPLLTGKDKEFRFMAAWALINIEPGHAGAIEVLLTELRAAHDSTRTRAAGVLGASGPSARAAIPTLVEALDDPDIDVREAAAEALRRIRQLP